MTGRRLPLGRRWQLLGWSAAVAVAAVAFVFGAVDEGPPMTNADRVNALARGFSCPVCSGQSVADSDVLTSREIRRRIAVWVDEGRTDDYIREQLVSAYGSSIDYNPSGSGVTGLVWVLPMLAVGGIVSVLAVMLRGGRLRRRADFHESAEPGSRSRFPGMRWRGWVAVWSVAVLAVSGSAGLLVARFSGSRDIGDSITGSVRVTARELIFQAQKLFRDGDLDGAIDAYDEALRLQPSNSEALAYKGWLMSRSGDAEAAAVYLDDAIGVDPRYPDARLFRSIVALDMGDGVRAAAELAAFDRLDPLPHAENLIRQADVRSRVNTAVLESMEQAMGSDFPAGRPPSDGLLGDGPPGEESGHPAFSSHGFTPREAVAAAEALVSLGRLLDAVRLLDWASESHPGDAEIMTGRGWLLARSRDMELLERGIGYLDAARSADPSNPRALVFSAFALLWRGQAEEAAEDASAGIDIQRDAEASDGAAQNDGAGVGASHGGTADAAAGDIPPGTERSAIAQAHEALAAFDRLDYRPPELLYLIEEAGLRSALG